MSSPTSLETKQNTLHIIDYQISFYTVLKLHQALGMKTSAQAYKLAT